VVDDILEKINLHIRRADSAQKEILKWRSIDSGIFDIPEKVRTVDSFVYRFIKLQDLAGQKLFKTYLDEIGEYRDDMSLLDVLDKLEKLKIIDDADKWMGFRKLRNELTHEYPDNEDEIIEGIKMAIKAFDDTLKIIDNLILRRKKYRRDRE